MIIPDCFVPSLVFPSISQPSVFSCLPSSRCVLFPQLALSVSKSCFSSVLCPVIVSAAICAPCGPSVSKFSLVYKILFYSLWVLPTSARDTLSLKPGQSWSNRDVWFPYILTKLGRKHCLRPFFCVDNFKMYLAAL